MITDRDLRNQLVYAIKTSDFDALAGVIADMISKGYDRGVDYGRRGWQRKLRGRCWLKVFQKTILPNLQV